MSRIRAVKRNMWFLARIEDIIQGGEWVAKLTEKQQRFADEYIRTGDVMRSYMNAYQNVTKENSANAGGSRLLRNVNVRSYVDKLLEELKSNAIADQEEVLSYFTSIMRGEHEEQVLKGIGMGEQKIAEMDVPDDND